jgi:ABC-type dipeptide/oligopeptide/nickel transport system permease component
MGLFTVTAVLTVIGILVSDLLLCVVDPRIAFGRRGQ